MFRLSHFLTALLGLAAVPAAAQPFSPSLLPRPVSARSGTGISAGNTLHRIDEAVVRAELRQAGFVLDAEGDFLRNPDDARDESSNAPRVPTDKFALRFVKPR